MNMYWIKIAVVFFIFFTIKFNTIAQIKVQIRNVNDLVQYTTDPWQYPIMKARIRTEISGIPVEVNKENILILENNRVSKPFFVGGFEQDTSSSDKWQLIKWYTKRKGPSIPQGGVTFMVDTILVFYENDIATQTTWHTREDLSYVRVHNYKDVPIIEKEFKFGEPGSSQNENIIVKAVRGMIDGSGSEGQVWIDSVTVDNENFRIKWDGWINDKSPPPLHIWSGMPYYVRLYYEPKSNDFHVGKFTVYYDHGLKSDIMLMGHEFHIPEKANILKLTYPTGVESFTPCQEIEIKWKGYIRGMVTFVDFSPNGGSTWENIGYSKDSTFSWTVPNIKSTKGLIRVRQDFNSSYPVELEIDNSPVNKIDFNYDGSRLLSASGSGIITSWNTVSESADKIFYLDKPNYPNNRYIQTGLSYIESDSIFVVSYYNNKDYPQKDSLAFFNVNDSLPYFRTELAVDFYAKKSHFDSKKEILALTKSISTKIKLYSLNDGNFIRDLNFDYPVSAFSFSIGDDLAAVALWNGEIKILSVPDFNVIKTLDYSNFPLILSLSLAPNGKYLAIGCKASERTFFSDRRTDVFIVNLPTNQIIRRMRKLISDPIAMQFSPKSTKLLIGAKEDRQIIYWNLPVDNVFSSFKDHNGLLTDFAFSPNGSMIATSADARDVNLYLRRFSYAESDENDSLFNIITPSLSIDNIQFPAAYIAESNDYFLNDAVCVDDTSLVYLQVDSLSIKDGNYYHLLEPISHDTLIFPDDCMPLNINYNPLDTGKIIDTVFIHSCGRKIPIPLNSEGLQRNIELLTNEIEFEPTCMGTIVRKTFPIAINRDPVPLLVNSVEIIKKGYTPFLCLNDINQVYQTGDTIFADIRFEPYALKEGINDLIIFHSNQKKFQTKLIVKGLGIGTEYELSHYDLRFIPEVLTRQLEVINYSDEPIYIQEVNFNPEGYFSLLTQLPVDISVQSSDSLDIKWNIDFDTLTNPVTMTIVAGPCAEAKEVILGRYSATSKFNIPDLFADPRNRATISINYKNETNHPYDGPRFLEGEIILNPRFFLPDKVTSDYGEGHLTRNEILNDRRIIGFRIEGNLPEEGTAAKIHGYAGLAEIDTSHINMLPNEVFWGSAVDVVLDYSIFTLINICYDRLVIQNKNITNTIINPNPSEGIIHISFDSEINSTIDIEIYDPLGLSVHKNQSININKGKNEFDIDLSDLKSGNYNLVIKGNDFKEVLRVILIK